METPRRTKQRRIQEAVQKSLREIQGSQTTLEPHNDIVRNNGIGSGCLDSPENYDYSLDYLTREGESDNDSSVNNEEISNNFANFTCKKSELREWAVKHNITHLAIADLLKLVCKWLPADDFPVDPRTLMKTPRHVNISNIAGGQYYYFGLKEVLIKTIEEGLNSKYKGPNISTLIGIPNLITLTIGVDGLPLSKSSNVCFWPILAYIDQALTSKPFPVALFYGQAKPNDLSSFLRSFIEEVVFLERNGLVLNDILYSVRLRCIISDAPSRSFLKCIKLHNAYYGCERCYCKGYWRKRVLFKNRKYDIYTDETFRAQVYKKHHDNMSPLCQLQLGLISQIPIDYMHLVCLGVMKKLLLVWTEGKHKLSPRDISEISTRLLNFKKLVPSNFVRKCRSLKDLKHFKATEFRLFVLYVGPVVLKGILDSKKFEHFLLLHSAIYILCSTKSRCNEWIEYAGGLLSKFVCDIEKLYYEELLTYNMHSLKHLHLDVHIFGSLDNFSAFKFENYMQQLKKLLRAKTSHLSQVVRRLTEIGHCGDQKAAPLAFKKLSIKTADHCFLTRSGDICCIDSYSEENRTVCVKIFDRKKNCKFYPFKSSLIGIYACSNLQPVSIVSYDELKTKVFKLPYKNRYICIPLCHSDTV